jgi:hypothetical protein
MTTAFFRMPAKIAILGTRYRVVPAVVPAVSVDMEKLSRKIM